jgi:AcrR family transcriptional regulator
MSPRENHRERLLCGALKCVYENGYAHTTSRDIAAASGSNLGSIGYHFGSKEHLLNAAIREGCSEWTDQLRQLAFADEGATPAERLRASWLALTDTFEEHRQLLVAFVELHTQAERSAELRDYLAEIYNESRAAVARMVNAALSDVEIGEDHMRAITSLLIAAHNGLLLQWLVDPQTTPSGPQLIDGLQSILPAALTLE